MGLSITNEGARLRARLEAQGNPLIIDTFLFAYIPGLDPTAVPDPDQAAPEEHMVFRARIPEEFRAFVNPDQVVYSALLGSDIGPFHLNWEGLYCSEHDVLMAVHTFPTLEKHKYDKATNTAGNNLTRNVMLSFSGARELTAITVEAKVWQLDFTVRLKGIDERERLSNRDIYGRAEFLDKGWLLVNEDGFFRFLPGVGYVEGIRAGLNEDMSVPAPALPCEVFLDVCMEPQSSDVITMATPLFLPGAELPEDYVTPPPLNVRHYVEKIAHVDEYGVVTDARKVRGREGNLLLLGPEGTFTGLAPGPDGTVLMSLDNTLIWQPWKIPYVLPAGEMNLYVRPDGNDDNDGSKNTPERAFASLEKACQWVREREFYGPGFISIRVADGQYQQTGNGYSCATTFHDTAPYWFAPDLCQPICRETHRIRVIGNMASPANVLITLNGEQTINTLANAHFYGLTFRHTSPDIFKDSLASFSSATSTNCRFIVGAAAQSPFGYVLRFTSSSGAALSGKIDIVFEATKTCWQILSVGNNTTSIGAEGHDANGNVRNIHCNIAVTGNVTVGHTAVAHSASYIKVIPGYLAASSFVGPGITGARYASYYNAVITTGGYGVNFFPGSLPGYAAMPTATIS